MPKVVTKKPVCRRMPRPAAAPMPAAQRLRDRLEGLDPPLSELCPRLELRQRALGCEEPDTALLTQEWINDERCMLCDRLKRGVDPVNPQETTRWAFSATCMYCQQSKSQLSRWWSNTCILNNLERLYAHQKIVGEYIHTLQRVRRFDCTHHNADLVD